MSEQEFSLKSPDGSKTISLVCNDGLAGLWLTDHKTGRTIAIYVEENQTGLGIYHNALKSHGLNIGLSVDPDGNPYMQLVNSKGERKILSWDKF